jgi:hypothetical protein
MTSINTPGARPAFQGAASGRDCQGSSPLGLRDRSSASQPVDRTVCHARDVRDRATMESSSGDDVSTDQQDVMVGVCGRDHACRQRAEHASSVDLLAPGILMGGSVGPGPEAARRAGVATVDVAAEDDGAGDRATCKERPELGALRAVGRHLVGLRGS